MDKKKHSRITVRARLGENSENFAITRALAGFAEVAPAGEDRNNSRSSGAGTTDSSVAVSVSSSDMLVTSVSTHAPLCSK